MENAIQSEDLKLRKVHGSTGAMSTLEKTVGILRMVGHLKHAPEVT